MAVVFFKIPVFKPDKSTPLIFLTVAALPTDVTSPVKFAFVVTVAALPVTLPTIGAVTVKFANVPTLVKLDARTLLASVAPVKVEASATAEIVISALPSKSTLLIFLGAANFVAVAALPVTLPTIVEVKVWAPVKV